MKPKGWNKMEEDERIKRAFSVYASPHGKYIISQALHYGIKSLKAVEPKAMRECSNIEDMEMLQLIFDIPIVEPEEAQRIVRRTAARNESIPGARYMDDGD